MKKEENEVYEKPKKTGLIVGIIIGVIILATILTVVLILLLGGKKDKNSNTNDNTDNGNTEEVKKLSNKEVSEFDLEFLKMENGEKNVIYSPLSIKYALLMLNEGTLGNSNKQIKNVIGKYEPKEYTNSDNKSFANALFVKNSFKDSIKTNYSETLKSKYDAEVVYDSFETAKNLNDWVSNHTFGLIKDLFDDVSDKDFILVNALAIDMEWNKKIQPEHEDYTVDFKREQFNVYVPSLTGSGYRPMDFYNYDDRKSVQFAAVANRYDIFKDLGEEKIKNTVTYEYKSWLIQGAPNSCDNPEPVDTFVSKYMEELKENYGHLSSSTDFLFYDDEDVKVFAKDLKEYDGSTLQYVGIMPKNVDLTEYVSKIDATKLNKIISSLKEIKEDSFKDGVITYVHGTIPVFNFDYEMDLKEDLIKLGVSDVFDQAKADISNITSSKNAFIADASQKATIDFSNDGIKAAAATQMGGLGAMDCGFEYDFEVPIEEIDLTFDNPYMFLIRDKDTGEVWFVGTVYEPTQYEQPSYYYW